jgi:signal transduction histidine kinase
MVAGVSARLKFDAYYRDFFDLVKTQVTSTIANARSYEEERKRAEALAELDRAKTAFFSNVSHEFRTPLTLMLGPIEEMLRRSYFELSPATKDQLEIVNRNGLRLLRLVNTLLDFARIEAGRVRAIYQPTDLASFTADLASVFRAAIERAGLRLVVDCPTLSEQVYVDRDMWEKILLNLLSNAFKFTFKGQIEVTLRAASEAVELHVADTGTGIPAEEMPHLFERFHRVQNARGRTHEGSGIGLALVQELVRLHGGIITAKSEVGKGTTFTIKIPTGAAHLPSDQIGSERQLSSATTGAKSYVEEAMRWLPDGSANENHEAEGMQDYSDALPTPAIGSADGKNRPLVLVADDNSDMRQYVTRVLRAVSSQDHRRWASGAESREGIEARFDFERRDDAPAGWLCFAARGSRRHCAEGDTRNHALGAGR